jgi:hypothetical protein
MLVPAATGPDLTDAFRLVNQTRPAKRSQQ